MAVHRQATVQRMDLLAYQEELCLCIKLPSKKSVQQLQDYSCATLYKYTLNIT